MVQLNESYHQSQLTQEQLPNTVAGCQEELKILRTAHQQELVQRQQVENKLRASQQLLQLVMDTLPAAIFWKDRNCNYLGCNKNFAEDAGLHSPSDIIGKNDYEMPWKKEESDFFRECDQRVMQADTAELGIIEPILVSSGEQLWLETNKAPLHDEDGNVIGILGTYQDITRRKQAEAELQKLNKKLQQQTADLNTALSDLKKSQLQLIQSEKMSALGNLVAGIAHEVNNPLGFLIGNLKSAQEYIHDLLEVVNLYQELFPSPGEEIEQKLEKAELNFLQEDLPKTLASMKEGINRICDISTSLRTFSRADTTVPTTFNIHEGLDSTLLILKHRLKAGGQRPPIQVYKKYGELPDIECFAGQLNQVFMNLLSNAIDALEESNNARSLQDMEAIPNIITVTTSISDDNSHIHISIADNGPGVSIDVQHKLFKRYFTTKSVGKGTGLGLAISHQIITEKHDGTLSIISKEGQGAEFIIRLPVKPFV